jgi:cytochrome c oxidase assembly protein subunit 15
VDAVVDTVSPALAATLVRLAGLAMLIAAWPLGRWWWRHRRGDADAALGALTLLTAFLTFDLIVFGAFTRLTDSGLGCPDWPGCYGLSNPIAAAAPIQAAQAAMPTGPVTETKAWIEMIHRYLAMAIGVLIAALTAAAWRWRGRSTVSPWWPTAALAWVVAQGLFGRWTVTLKLYPAIVSLHLFGGVMLLALLLAQHRVSRGGPGSVMPVSVPAVAAVWLLAVIQLLLGGWVSSNYAVLACQGFPTCNGQWWPIMDFGAGFQILRDLGRAADGSLLPFDALVAIQFSHRVFAAVVFAAGAALTWRLTRGDADPAWRGFGRGLGILLVLQAATGLSNVVLGWPIIAALAHTGGAAALIALLTVVLVRATRAARRLASA